MSLNEGNGEETAPPVVEKHCVSDFHAGVRVSYSTGACPLCAALAGGEAVAVAAVKAGMVLVGLSLSQVPFRFAPADPAYAPILVSAVGKINAAMQDMARALNGGEAPVVKAAPKGLFVPR